MEETRATRGHVILIIVIGILVIALALLEALAGRKSVVDAEVPWADAIKRTNSDLQRGDVSGAVRGWHDAHLAALASRRWEGMIEVGDAALRMAAIAPPRRSWEPRAREAYMAALFRARSERSVDGVLRATEGFGTLNDRHVVDMGVQMARVVAGYDAQTVARVEEFAMRLNNSRAAILSAQSEQASSAPSETPPQEECGAGARAQTVGTPTRC